MAHPLSCFAYSNQFKPGVCFVDIGSMLADPSARRAMFRDLSIAMLAVHAKITAAGKCVDGIVAVGARGFLIGPMLAELLNVPLLMARPTGKMPNAVAGEPYETEYGPREGLALQRHVVYKGMQLLAVDDIRATGGTFVGVKTAAEKLGAELVGTLALINVDLPLHSALEGIPYEFVADSKDIVAAGAPCLDPPAS